MKKLLLSLSGIAIAFASFAQCAIREVTLQQRANASSLIVEGKVTAQHSYWDANNTMIYTASTIEVYKIFKGDISTSTIEILTQGGIVGERMIKVEPSLQLHTGETGIFTCEPVSRIHVPLSRMSAGTQYEAYASVQGFVKYNLQTQSASDAFHTYSDIETELYPVVSSMRNYRELQAFNIHSTGRAPDFFNVAAISGFSPTTVTAGTGTTITITGTGFGATQGSGTVGFKNADDGGATYINPLPSQYISWSSTQIVVEVPASAGTGTIQVTQGVTTTSAGTLTISYAHLNVEFDPGPGTIAYQTDHVDDNGSGGYTWRMNTGFDSDAPARASFMRAFDSWRCATGVNWTVGATTSINDAVSDGTNIICYDNAAPLSAGILGVCYSYWSGCASGPTIIWYVNELDIIFDEGSNISPLTWEFGPATPSGSEYDFETVAVHELGHGHQLGHVISGGAIMHYAISNGASNRTPGVNDLAGGNYVQSKSLTANVCGPGACTNYSCASPPTAVFDGSPTTLCAGGTVSFTDQSTNTPTSWAWIFTGGTPSSSTAQNPTITYNTPGVYDVTLTATNAAGSDPVTVNGYITVNACGSPPVASFSGSPTTLCSGGTVSFSDLSTNTPTSWAWTFTGGTPSSSTAQNPTIAYNTPGTYAVTLTATNAFGSDPVTINSYITVNSCGGTQLNASSCGLTLTAINQYVYCVPVANANNYYYHIFNTNIGYDQVYPRGNASTNFNLTWLPGIQNGVTYSIQIAARVGTTWSGYGPVCTLTTPAAVPAPQLTPAWCGNSVTALDQQIYCTAIGGATQYLWKVSHSASSYTQTYVRNSSSADFRLSWLSGVQYGKTYDVQIAAYVGGSWGAYGNVCTITTPAFPSTQVAAPNCGATLAAVSTVINCTPVVGATDYLWHVTNASSFNSTVLRTGVTTFKLSLCAGVQVNTTYNVEVAARVGGVWSAYGPVCSVTTGPVQMAPFMDQNTLRMENENGEAIGNDPAISVYPNPATDNITVEGPADASSIAIYTMFGELVRTESVNGTKTEISLGDLAPGMYLIEVQSPNGMVRERIIRQ